MRKKQTKSSNPLQRLLAMPPAERIEAIIKDLVTREDQFRKIEPHDLAEAIGISDAGNPGGDWTFTQYGVKVPIEEYAELHDLASELVYLIQDKVSSERFEALLNYSSDLDDVEKPGFHFLTPEERELLEEAIGSEELRVNRDNGMCIIAHYSVQTPSGYRLSFEADIEGDGACISGQISGTHGGFFARSGVLALLPRRIPAAPLATAGHRFPLGFQLCEPSEPTRLHGRNGASHPLGSCWASR